ncbi:MAG: LNS2 domain-containing protein [Bacillota bacterium]
MNKIFGIDIDGVITDEGSANDNIWHNALCDHFSQNLNRIKNVYDFAEAYNLSERELNEFINENIEYIYKNVKVYPKASKVINQLYNNGFKIHLITARHKEYNNITKNWLKKHSIPYHSLSHEDDKAPLALKKNIELFIEDNYNNAIDIANNGIKVLLMNKYHNLNRELINNITRVNNWDEIVENINKLYNINLL